MVTTDAQGPPYPTLTNATYTCPCGYEWEAEALNKYGDPNRDARRNKTSIIIQCLGTLRWMAYDLTRCIPGLSLFRLEDIRLL
jgi:hypothetical protein